MSLRIRKLISGGYSTRGAFRAGEIVPVRIENVLFLLHHPHRMACTRADERLQWIAEHARSCNASCARASERFRLCYEKGLREKPTMAGRVDVRFSITRTGSVESPSATSATLTSAVVSCVEKAFPRPFVSRPEGGRVVKVLYPISFVPS